MKLKLHFIVDIDTVYNTEEMAEQYRTPEAAKARALEDLQAPDSIFVDSLRCLFATENVKVDISDPKVEAEE